MTTILIAVLVLNLCACARVLWGSYKPNAEERLALPFMGALMLAAEVALWAVGAMVGMVERVTANYPRRATR